MPNTIAYDVLKQRLDETTTCAEVHMVWAQIDKERHLTPWEREKLEFEAYERDLEFRREGRF